MKRLLLPGFLLLALTTLAQKPETATVLIHYKFKHVRDTGNRAHPYTENMVLFVGKSAGAYWTWDGILADQQFKSAYAQAAASCPDGNARVDRGRGANSGTRYYQYPNEQKLFTKDNLMGNEYLMEGSIPAIQWTISGDTATFGGLHCQKASCHFKGREYTVWFCPDIPVHTGPWKLNGLPGVIVDARDAKNEVEFAFDGVEKAIPSKSQPVIDGIDEKDFPPILRGLNYDPNLILPPATAIKTTQKDYDKLKETMLKDPQGFAQAVNAAASQGDGPKMDHMIVKPASKNGPGINNPMELPEQK